MKYTALYRQWRPGTFDEVVGQDHIVRTLMNQIKTGRIGHAYLFCGSRGTGKTSTAKIFARAINCTQTKDGSPCGLCDVCLKLSSGNNMDIIEIDAASNNGVDEIRELRDKVKFPPTAGAYKVYIIDEVHMLSMGAFNALLKTLEEPPSHVVFILATTEPHRLPATILSRCQRYDFQRISVGVMRDRLQSITAQMGVEVEVEALYTIARWAEGGMRDALSLLDQCIGFCGDFISNQDVLSILGTADQSFIFELSNNMIQGDTSSLLGKIDQLVEGGKDLTVFLKDVIQHLRNLLLVNVCEQPEELLDVTSNTMEALKVQAENAGEERLIRAIEILSSLEADMKWSTQPRVLVELAMIKVCRPQQEESMEAVLDRLRELEAQIASGVVPLQQSASAARGSGRSAPPKARTGEAGKAVELPRNPEGGPESQDEAVGPAAVRDAEEAWPEVLKAVKKERMALYPLLKDVRLKKGAGETAQLVFPAAPEQGFLIAAVDKEANRVFLEELVHKLSGQKLKLRCQTESDPVPGERPPMEDEVVRKAIELFGEDFVEVVDEEP